MSLEAIKRFQQLHVVCYLSVSVPNIQFIQPLLKSTTLIEYSTHHLLDDALTLSISLLNLLILVKPPPRIEINLRSIDPSSVPVVNLCSNVDNDDSNDRDIHREEALRRVGLTQAAQGPDGEIELGDDEDDTPEEAPVGAPWPGPRFPGQFGGVAALDFPGVAHADVREADHAPAEEGEEGG